MPKKKAATPSAGTSPEKSDTAVKKSGRGRPAASVSTHLIVDHPLEREIISSQTYSFRLSALEPRSVEVSLDGKEWRPCRESVGFWWYDWSGYRAGTYTLHARMTDRNGKAVRAKPRQFTAII